jgi:hypothetical protein
MDYNNLSNRLLSEEGSLLVAAPTTEETLVTDSRAGLSPAQMVERRLASLLQNAPPPAGRSQHRGSQRARG